MMITDWVKTPDGGNGPIAEFDLVDGVKMAKVYTHPYNPTWHPVENLVQIDPTEKARKLPSL